MAEKTTILDGNGSVARVAFDLAEKVTDYIHASGGPSVRNRKDFLDLYAECYEAAKGHRDVIHD